MRDTRDGVSLALERLVARFSGLLRSVGRRRGLSEADLDELCQDVRIRLWQALSSGEKISALHTSYVYRTAVTAALDMIRRRRARREEHLEEARDSGETEAGAIVLAPDGRLEQEDLAASLSEAVASLAQPRDVVVRLYLAGYHREEIAALLGWTEAKTRNLLYRGLADLRVHLAEAGLGPSRLA